MVDEPNPTTTATQSPTPTPTPTPTPDPPQSSTILNEPEPKFGADGKPIPAEAPAGAPEKYEDFKVPDGITLDTETLGAATGLFKDLGVSQENAQKLMDFHTAQLAKAGQANIDLVTAQRAEWRDAVAKDPEIGPKMAEVKGRIGEAFNLVTAQQGGDKVVAEFKQAMDMTGAGDNPAFIKFFDRLAKIAGEGRSVSGRGPSPLGQKAPGENRSAAATLWPDLPSAAPQRG